MTARGSCRRAAFPRGFTLIELLVALFIAAVMFAIGYGAINQALQNRGTITRHQQSLVQLESAMQIMEQDFVQIEPRPVRNPGGNGFVPCLLSGQASDASDASDTTDDSDSDTAIPLVQLTRGGWSNPIGEPRTELERVAYVMDNDTLVREHWNVLDGTLSSLPVKRNLLKHVRSVSFQYMSITHSWVDNWPPTATSGENIADSLDRVRPLAVQVTLDTQQWGRITRIFEVTNDQ
jgi:general secretion pathway protein J